MHHSKSTRVKFCGLVRPDDVRLASALGVGALGLVFYERSPRVLDLESARHLRTLMPSWICAVGLFVNAPPAQVREYSAALGLDVVQYHGNETQSACRDGLLPGQPYWRAVRMRQQADLLTSWADYSDAESFLLDAHSEGYGGAGELFDWSLIPADHGRSLIVSGGLDANNVGAAINGLSPAGVDVSTGIQGSDPRRKDPAKMEEFIAAVVQADALAIKG